MSKNNIGLYDTKRGKWLPWVGDRMAKPTRYNTSASPEALRQFAGLSDKDSAIVMKRMSAAELGAFKDGGAA